MRQQERSKYSEVSSALVGDESASDEEEQEADDGEARGEDLLSGLRTRGPSVKRVALAVASVVALCFVSVLFAVYPAVGRTSRAKGEGLLAKRPDGVQLDSVCLFDKATACPARALFDSPRVHEVATHAVMRVGQRILTPADEGMARALVAASFSNVSSQLLVHAPEVISALDILDITGREQDAVMRSLMLLGDPRVQRVGLGVSRAIRGGETADRGAVRQRIEAALRPQAAQLVRLRDALVPLDVREIWGGDSLWDLSLDPENVRVMQAGGRAEALLMPEQGRGLLVGVAPAETASELEKQLAVSWGAREEARALLDAVMRLAKMPKREQRSSAQVVSPSSTLDSAHRALFEGFSSGPSACADEDREASSAAALVCALRFGAQGVDALRAASSLESGLPDSAFGSSGAMDVSSIGLT